ncbi:MAG: DsbA family protein [Deltaproteobacteria bacterium]|nr:DsbA family protein [Deltaproteobacteria bacterium]
MRLRRLGEEFGDRVRVEWRSFLLRPQPDPGRTLEKFRAYTRSWLRASEEPDGGTFRVWESDAGPPSHSLPPHLVAKAAAQLGDDAFARMHERLLHACFAENRDITDTETLRALWYEAGLPDDAFARSADPALLQATVDEYKEALQLGISGVPAVRLEGSDGHVLGAQPLELYRRWISRTLSAAG